METLRNLTLEISSKALHDQSPGAVERAFRTAFRQWRPLADRAKRLSVLLWTADGSELLDWSGDFTDTFEWACWCGCANRPPPTGPTTTRQRRNSQVIPKKVFPDAECAPRPYAWLRDVVALARAAAHDELGRDIRVGTTFDGGPEFAISGFKYRRHREAMLGDAVFKGSFLSCDATLHADGRRYAAFPNGIPEGLSIGSFLGAQYRAFAHDFGFDYIWLSNGMGFGREPWGVVGALFDKKSFHPERIDDASGRMMGFWRDFFAACPDAMVETRGSNYSAGVEMASDAAPLAELYRDGRIEPPVNSPWAALNFDTGLELAAWMSHVAELPAGRGFPFRFYIHDPWFLNSPWLDRYGREPWDLFAPLSVCRLGSDGSVQTPDSVALLSVDDTLGRMPEIVPREVAPLIIDALETAPDRAGPITWVYPFDEYADAVSAGVATSDSLARVFNEDMFLGEALQGGLPLNTVVSTRIWRELAAKASSQSSAVRHPSLFIVPVSALHSSSNLAAMEAFAAKGAGLIVYGPLAGAPMALLARLGLSVAEPLGGDFTVETLLPGDMFEKDGVAQRIRVIPAFDGGGLTEVPAKESDAQILAWAEAGNGSRRVLASRNGAFAYVRSVTPSDGEGEVHHCRFDHAPATRVFPVERLARHLLGATFGWSILSDAPTAGTPLPRTNISRHGNAFIFTVFSPDTTASLRVRTPYGAPLLTERETRLRSGAAEWRPDKSWRRECRLFVDGQCEGVVAVKTHFAAHPGYAGRLRVLGLDGATLRFFPPDGFRETIELVRTPNWWEEMGEDVVMPEWIETPDGTCAVWHGLSGSVFIAW
ncbi:MAG: hypothetical protein IJT64_00880 [Kiritimatiellae bacterium]|nr:hypothetical protein [Kiritimatiellia bacterium]